MTMIIAVDFDGTIVEHEFPRIGRPVPGAIKWLKKFQELGALLILYTMRSAGQDRGDVLLEAVRYCQENGIEFWGINTNPNQTEWTQSPKAYAHLYIDDAALGCPLTRFKQAGRRPMVNWNVVGPKVSRILKKGCI